MTFERTILPMNASSDRPSESTLARAVRYRALKSVAYTARTAEELREELYKAQLLLEQQGSELETLRHDHRQEAQRAAHAEVGS